VEQESPSGTEEARITPPELDYLMAALSARFPGLALSHADVLSTFAGVRPIVGGGNEDPSKESRDSVLWEESGLLTVTGGKLTTFHATARTAVRLVLRRLGGRGLGALRAPIAASPAATLVASGLAPEDEKRLLARFGTDAGAVVAVAREGELSRLPHLPILWAELRWAARSESVVHLDDLMLRRVRAGLLLPSGAASLLPSIRAICQTELGWDDARWEEEARRYIGLWKNNYSLPA
jgi:glycerol-3-phosphate dehydrogenase